MAVTLSFGHHGDRAPTHGYEPRARPTPIGATSRNALELLPNVGDGRGQAAPAGALCVALFAGLELRLKLSS
jgi:hypothetical protein